MHGIVYARGTVKGKKVAFVARAHAPTSTRPTRRSASSQLNDPDVDARPAVVPAGRRRDINFAFNWAYVDADHIAYQLSGWYPQRAKGTSPDFPILGTGEYDWQGFNPRPAHADWCRFAKHPHAVDPPYLVSWNNKQAPGWAAADDKYAYGPLFRSQMIARHGRRRRSRASEDDARAARPGDGGAGDRRTCAA